MFNEYRVSTKNPLQPRQAIQQLPVRPRGCGVPPRVRRKAIVEDVEPGQILDFEMDYAERYLEVVMAGAPFFYVTLLLAYLALGFGIIS